MYGMHLGLDGEGGSRRQRERLCLCTLHFTNAILFPKHYYSNFSSISSWQNEDVSLGLSLRMGPSNEMHLRSRQHCVCVCIRVLICMCISFTLSIQEVSCASLWYTYIPLVLGAALTTYVHTMCLDASILPAAPYNEKPCLSRLWIYCITTWICVRCSVVEVINAGLNCPASVSSDPGFPPSPQP